MSRTLFEVDQPFFYFNDVLVVDAGGVVSLLLLVLLRSRRLLLIQFLFQYLDTMSTLFSIITWTWDIIINIFLIFSILLLGIINLLKLFLSCLQRTMVPFLGILELFSVMMLLLLLLFILIFNHLHVISMQTLRKHHLILLILHLNLGLIIAELLENFPLLLLG